MSQIRIITALLVIVVLTGCSSRSAIVTGMIPPVPKPEISDPKIIQSFAAQTIKQRRHAELSLISSGPEVARVQNILNQLLQANNSPHKYYAFVVNNYTTNAFTDGRAIYVHSQMLNKLRNDNDLAAIVSHELAHITAGHSADEATRLADASGGSALLSAISYNFTAPVTEQASTKKVTRISLIVGAPSSVSAYERKQEREADEIGMMMAAKAGYDPEGFMDFWTQADDILGHSNLSGGLLATHPSNEERRANIKAALPIAKAYYSCVVEKKQSATRKAYCKDLLASAQCSSNFCAE